MRVFLSGGTGYVGRSLITALLSRGHSACTLARAGSERKSPAGCTAVWGNALDAATFESQIPPSDAFVHLTGVPHPSPAKARQFREIDQVSLEQSVGAAAKKRIPHFVYVSVARPAPVMKVYQQVRAECEATIESARLDATILRPWYILGPGHYWPYALLPFYRVFEWIPATREGATRLGLVTLQEMTNALMWAIENPAPGCRVMQVSDIRRHGV